MIDDDDDDDDDDLRDFCKGKNRCFPAKISVEVKFPLPFKHLGIFALFQIKKSKPINPIFF